MLYGEKIKELRGKAGMDQKSLAEKLGISAPALSDIEGSAYPPLKRIEQICDIFKIEMAEFFMTESYKKNLFGISPLCLELAVQVDKLPDNIKNKFLKHIESGLDLLD